MASYIDDKNAFDSQNSQGPVRRPSSDSRESGGDIEVDHVAEKKLVRKLDLHIVPVVMLLYLLSFLDRVNIGNARLYGMEKDLGLKGNQYQTATSLLFVTYVSSELPSNLVLKKFTPKIWISTIAVLWGIIATLTGVTKNYAGLIACRILLGLVEGGLFPGLAIYLTFFYTSRELALRVGYLFVSAALAGACGGLLAYGIGFMDGVGGVRAWRWIMIIEGLPTFLLGLSCYFLLANSPSTAYYLTSQEKTLLTTRLLRQPGQTASGQQMHKKDVLLGLRDWKIYAFCIGQFGADTMLYGYSTFLPTIIQGIGAKSKWTTAQVQALTIPCYALGALTYLLVARLSDAQQVRGPYCVLFGGISVIGYGILLSDAPSGVHYFGCFVVAMGLYVVAGLPLAWLPSNQPRYGKRTTATGLQLMIGNTSGIMAPFIYPTSSAPQFKLGHATTLAMVGMASLIYAAMWIYFRRENAVREREDGRSGESGEGGEGGLMTAEERRELGEGDPEFRFMC